MVGSVQYRHNQKSNGDATEHSTRQILIAKDSDMIKLKKLLTEDKRPFRGDCVGILDSGDDLFADATNMAQVVEQSTPITYEQFLVLADITGTSPLFKLNLRTKPDQFSFAQYKDMVWAYDEHLDVHYFFL